jgi:hypothetical protein
MSGFESFDFQQSATIPTQCEGCGVQCELRTALMGLQIAKHMMQQAAGGLVGESGEAFDAMIDEQVPAEVADQIKLDVRKMAGRDIESLDESIDRAQQEIDSNALSCSGVLKMRASKGDVTYTVSVCTSQKQYVRDGRPSHLPVHIKAESANRI